MNSTYLQPSEGKLPYCEMSFGIAGLHNSSLIEQYFPEDLPEDWRVSYYSNDFHLLLISPLDLSRSLPSDKNLKAMSPDNILEAVARFNVDIEDDFSLLFDMSMLADNTQQVLCEIQMKENIGCYFINLKETLSEIDCLCPAELECLFMHLGNSFEHSLNKSPNNSPNYNAIKNNDTEEQSIELLCIVKSDGEVKPLELKKLIEQIRAYAMTRQHKSVSLIFSSAHGASRCSALDNCRKAILLESMM